MVFEGIWEESSILNLFVSILFEVDMVFEE